MTQEAEQTWKPSRNPWLVALPTIIAAFMFVLDETIANVSLSNMAGTFSASRDESLWIITSYLIGSGIMIPAVDWFSKLMGRKNYFMMSIAIFTISSFACALSSSMGMMILARFVQGLGGGGLLPVSQAVLLETFPLEKRPQAMATFGLVIIVAPILGPIVGGYITDNYSWPWIFLINIPIGIFAIYISKLFLEDPPYAQKQKDVYIDGKGFLFLTMWIVSMQIILEKGNNADWFNTAWICRLTVFMVISAVLFFWSQIKNKRSLIDLTVFKDKNFAVGTIVQIVIQMVLLASLAILPQFLQSIMGYTALLSGLSIMPRGLGSLISMILCGTLASKIDNRILAAIGLTMVGISSLMLGNINLQIASIDIVIPNFIFGFGMSFAMIPLVTLSAATLRNDQMTNASGVQNMLKNVGGAIGTSLAGTMITRYSQIHQANMVHNLTPLNPVFQAKMEAMKGAFSQLTHHSVAEYMAQYSLYGEMLEQATLWGFMETFRIFGLATIIIVPLVFIIKSPKGAKDAKH